MEGVLSINGRMQLPPTFDTLSESHVFASPKADS
jgi:hypothetical protein